MWILTQDKQGFADIREIGICKNEIGGWAISHCILGTYDNPQEILEEIVQHRLRCPRCHELEGLISLFFIWIFHLCY